MLLKTNNASALEPIRGHGWWLRRWAGDRILAGITGRETDVASLLQQSARPLTTVAAEQVHGASVAIVERAHAIVDVLPGCDALLTSLPGIALLIRTADCLPVFFSDPSRNVVGLAHAGWRGLAAGLLPRVVAAFQHTYHITADHLDIAIGPAIHACCYDVGPEFVARFGAYIEMREGHRTCNLIAAATDQLQQAGVRSQKIMETGHCTACEIDQWFSLRREGPSTGRMTSLIAVKP
ncbi:MAG: polyphenol oxidase family protein [Candidatus Omnitrophica bacterium]|nr:polyphenol oxidase family protein [Candidatus Omnitrophota bacterium]